MPPVAPHPIVQLFCNPASGNYSPRVIDALVAAFQALGARVERTESHAGPPPVLAAATHVCIAGGDGTVRHVAMALLAAGCRVPVAIYPAGTVNLLAREGAGWSGPAEFAARLLGDGPLREHYPVNAGDTQFLACASVGLDSIAVAGVSKALKARIGRLAYAAAFLRLLRTWPRPRLTLRSAERSLACEAVFVAKSRYYAGPWSFAPAARGDDGLLHVAALPHAGRLTMARFALALLRGRDPARLPGIVTFTCRDLAIDGDSDLPVQLDGDADAHLPLRLAVAQTPLLLR